MKIGVFDSGLGGLTVLRALARHVPNADYVYLGDTARVPYGIRSQEVITRYATESLFFLLEQKIDLCVIACNTVSAYALDALRSTFKLPIIGVVEPGVLAALKTQATRAIGVIGTEATVRSKAYETAILAHNPKLTILSQPCPLFVPLVEEGWLDTPVTEAVIRTYIGHFVDAKVEAVVLGCTHYPLLKPALARVLGEGIVLVDSAEETALAIKTQLLQTGETLSDTHGSTEFFVTDQAERFDRISSLILDRPYAPVRQITLQI